MFFQKKTMAANSPKRLKTEDTPGSTISMSDAGVGSLPVIIVKKEGLAFSIFRSYNFSVFFLTRSNLKAFDKICELREFSQALCKFGSCPPHESLISY